MIGGDLPCKTFLPAICGLEKTVRKPRLRNQAYGLLLAHITKPLQEVRQLKLFQSMEQLQGKLFMQGSGKRDVI